MMNWRWWNSKSPSGAVVWSSSITESRPFSPSSLIIKSPPETVVTCGLCVYSARGSRKKKKLVHTCTCNDGSGLRHVYTSLPTSLSLLYTRTYIHTHLHAYIHTYTHTHTCMHTYTYAYIPHLWSRSLLSAALGLLKAISCHATSFLLLQQQHQSHTGDKTYNNDVCNTNRCLPNIPNIQKYT